ncbi:MAG: hypothetical protein Q4G39_08575, partial [Brachymonas sp.]|nr:hypothetical protein [Brachymonas sp.]
ALSGSHNESPRLCRGMVTRAENGLAMVACTTDMPDVTPQMIDWWFGWHLPESERYRLWHPLAHVRARVKDDRSKLPGDREKYVGNVSSVDEYIGEKLMRLDIAFFDPKEIGLAHVYEKGATAICARTSDRALNGDGGHLIHLVRRTDTGSEMRSVFWLGELNLKWPIIGRLIKPVLNTPTVRRVLVTNKMAEDLLRHCAEEMNHLPRFLPALYAEMAGGSANNS